MVKPSASTSTILNVDKPRTIEIDLICDLYEEEFSKPPYIDENDCDFSEIHPHESMEDFYDHEDCD